MVVTAIRMEAMKYAPRILAHHTPVDQEESKSEVERSALGAGQQVSHPGEQRRRLKPPAGQSAPPATHGITVRRKSPKPELLVHEGSKLALGLSSAV